MAGYPKYETCAKIDLPLLIQHGVLDESRPKRFGFESGEVPMILLYLPGWQYPRSDPELIVEFEVDGLIIFQQIAMGFNKTRKGQSPYLVCPASGARCSELFLHEYRFISRRQHPLLDPKKASPAHRREVRLMRQRDRLLGTDGRPAARGQERAKLIAMFQAMPLIQLRFPELRAHFEAEDQRRQRARKEASRPSVKNALNSTQLALRRGRNSTGHIDLAAHAVLSAEQWLARLPKPDALTDDIPIGFVEDHPALDLRALVKAWSIGPSGLWATIIVWPEVGGFLIADMRDPERPFLRLTEIQKRDGGVLPEQIIRLSRSSRNRWFFHCPLTDQRCELLFLREPVFASARAGRLIHRSQRAR